MEKIELVLDKVFHEHYGKNQFIFENYKNIYGLDTVYSESVVSKKLFEYCLRKKYFILLLLYDDEGRIFLDRNMSDTLNWGLPGGSVKDSEPLSAAIERVAKGVNNAIEISDIEPVTLIENEFVFQDKKFTHNGLGFIARVRNINEINRNKLVGDFITIRDEELEFINRLASRKVVDLFVDRFQDICRRTDRNFQDNEISINKTNKRRFEIHNKYMKKFILTDKAKRKNDFKKIISDCIGDSKSIIDVSCGDDTFIFDLARDKNMNLVVGNDISWSQVEDLNEKYSEAIFTNHNAAALPFLENSFDVTYCSNTLHHMPSKGTLIGLLNKMYDISKKMVVVEIENPSITGGFPKFLNKHWYIKFLGDVGGAYLSENQFKVIINKTFEGRAKIEFMEFKNIMGKYLIAIIEKENENV